MAEEKPTVGVALSGGGHRAALFGLGALLYLVDAGKGKQIRSIASVSGGSLTNAFFGIKTDLTQIESDDMWTQAQTFAHRVARRGTLWAAPQTWIYLFSIGLLAIAAFVASFFWPWWVGLLAWIIAFSLGGWLSQQRSAVVASAFNSTLLHGAKLRAMNNKVSHVMCATDLQMGQNVFFSDSFVYSWRSGWGKPGDMQVAQAAQASAALPGAFSVVSLPLSRFGLPESRVADRHPPQRFKLLDGGVYDNMGSEWILNLDERLQEGTPPAGLTTVDEAIIVNASAGDDVVDRSRVKIPFAGEIYTLLAVKDVMYRQTTAVRRRLLNLRYRVARDRAKISTGAALLDDALSGTTIQIDRSPFELANDFLGRTNEYRQRAQAAIDSLNEATPGDAEAYWAAEAEANRLVKTTLSRIERSRAQSLIAHGYVLTMVNCHVLLNYRLLPIPETRRFAWLLGKE
jgi:predicted acylesterase/phospholipase RssA